MTNARHVAGIEDFRCGAVRMGLRVLPGRTVQTSARYPFFRRVVPHYLVRIPCGW